MEEKQPSNKAVQLQHDLLGQTAVNEPVLVGEADTLEQTTKPLATTTAQASQISDTKVEAQTIPETEVLTIRQSHSEKVIHYNPLITLYGLH